MQYEVDPGRLKPIQTVVDMKEIRDGVEVEQTDEVDMISNEQNLNQSNNDWQNTGVNDNKNNSTNNESKKRVGWSGLQGYQGFQKT